MLAFAADASAFAALRGQDVGWGGGAQPQTFGEFQPRGAETRRSWYDWQERPETVSLLTGLAAIHALGPQAAMELLFGEAARGDASADSATRDERMDQLQGAVEEAMKLLKTKPVNRLTTEPAPPTWGTRKGGG